MKRILVTLVALLSASTAHAGKSDRSFTPRLDTHVQATALQVQTGYQPGALGFIQTSDPVLSAKSTKRPRDGRYIYGGWGPGSDSR